MTTLDMNVLTRRQREVFEQIAIGQDGGHPKRVLEALEKRGLIVGRPTLVDIGSWLIEVTRYQVPVPIHIQWCEWCSTQPDEEAL